MEFTSNTDHPLLVSSYGLIAGCAAGDAMGALVEGLNRQELAERIGEYDDFFDLKDVEWYREDLNRLSKYWRLPGAHTDDTQQLLSILDTYRKHGRIDCAEMAEGFTELFKWSRGDGGSFRKLCLGIKKKQLRWQKARKSESEGNGSAMRAGAIALIHPHDEGLLINGAIRQSCVTHGDVRSHMASVLIAVTARYALHQNREQMLAMENVRDFHQSVVKAVNQSVAVINQVCSEENLPCEDLGPRSSQFMESLSQITEFLDQQDSLESAGKSLNHLVDAIARIAEKNEDRIHSQAATGTLNFALEAPVAAYGLFLLFGTETKQAILRAIRLGGDTDSTAAMVGQLSGALVGFDLGWWEYPLDNPPSSVCGRAEYTVSITWFLQMRLNLGLLHLIDSLYEKPPVSAPRGFLSDDLNNISRSFLDYERSVTEEERMMKKELKLLVRFMDKSFGKLVLLVETELKCLSGPARSSILTLVRRVKSFKGKQFGSDFAVALIKERLAKALPEYGDRPTKLIDDAIALI